MPASYIIASSPVSAAARELASDNRNKDPRSTKLALLVTCVYCDLCTNLYLCDRQAAV